MTTWTMEAVRCGGRAIETGLAVPDAPNGAAVIVLHDITGLREDTRRHAERFAALGYVAAAPNLYDGIGCIVRTLAKLAGVGEGPLPEIAAVRDWVASRPDVDPGRLGVVGFCMGGGFALLTAADEAFAVAAPFYGPVPHSKERLRGICPTLAQFGAEDVLFRPDAARLKRHLEALGVDHEVIVYDGAGHSFMNDHPDPLWKLGRYTPMRARHEPEVEAKAWAGVQAFFAEHLGGPAPR